MNILITGAAGFIGSHLMDALRPTHDVYGFDNFLTGRKENTAGVLELDISDRQPLYALANEIEPSVVIHCAASYSDPDKWHRDTDTNIAGGINAALVAKYHRSHLLYFQTILPPVSSYAISKLAAEQYLRLAEVPLTVFRLANVYGPRNLSGPVPVFYRRLTRGEPCTVVDTTRDMLYVDDVVRAVVAAVEEGTTGTFDLCSGVRTPIWDIYASVCHELGIEGFSENTDVTDPLADDVQGTISVENRPPGWKSIVPLSEGIKRAVRFYRHSSGFETYTHLRLKG